MKTFSYLSLIFFSLSLNAAEVCHKCERIREYNKQHPGEFEFYEDYLKAEESKKRSQGKDHQQIPSQKETPELC